MSATADFMNALLKPLLTGAAPTDLSQYGGAANLGLSLLAGNPAPYRMPTAMSAARSALGARDAALKNAAARMQLAQGEVGLQRSLAMMPYYKAIMGGLLGSLGMGVPDSAPQDASSANLGGGAGEGSAPAAAPSGGAPSPAPAASRVAPSRLDPLGLMRGGLLASFAGLPGGQQALDFGKTMLQYDPAVASELALAKDPVTLDMLEYARAVRSGDPFLTQAFANKLKTDTGMQHIGSMSGIFTRVEPDGSVTTINPSTGLRVNSERGAEYLPGALSAFAAREGAEESARLRAGTQPAGNPAPGGGAPVPPRAAAPAGPAAAGGEPSGAAPIGAAAINAENYIPPVLAAPSRIAQRPGNTSLNALKETQEEQGRQAGKIVEGMREKATASQDMLTQTELIREAAASFTPGKYANVKGEVLAALQGLLPSGLLSQQQLNALGSYQEGQKLTIQLQSAATRILGAREAAQVFQTIGKSVPGLTLSPDGLNKVAGYMEGMARYNIAMATYAQRLFAQGNASGLNSLEQNFQTHSNPAYFILASVDPATRAELLSGMPPVKRAAFVNAWRAAASEGLAPLPRDYEGQ